MMSNKSENNIVAHFSCIFSRDGHKCNETLTIELPQNYESQQNSKDTALAIESAINTIKTKKNYDRILKMSLLKWSNKV